MLSSSSEGTIEIKGGRGLFLGSSQAVKAALVSLYQVLPKGRDVLVKCPQHLSLRIILILHIEFFLLLSLVLGKMEHIPLSSYYFS